MDVRKKQPVVLICDDNARDRESLRRALLDEKFRVLIAEDGRSARNILAEREVDLVVMESRLPDVDGYELCRSIRGTTSLPVIFLSDRSEVADRILGLKIGADDYVAKPFSPREVAVRAETVLRRVGGSYVGEKRLELGNVSLNMDSFTASVNGEPLELIPSDFKLLSYMLSNAGRVLSRERMLDAVWGYEYSGSQRSVDTQIKRIRAALKDRTVHFDIKSLYGVGYKLELIGSREKTE